MVRDAAEQVGLSLPTSVSFCDSSSSQGQSHGVYDLLRMTLYKNTVRTFGILLRLGGEEGCC